MIDFWKFLAEMTVNRGLVSAHNNSELYSLSQMIFARKEEIIKRIASKSNTMGSFAARDVDDCSCWLTSTGRVLYTSSNHNEMAMEIFAEKPSMKERSKSWMEAAFDAGWIRCVIQAPDIFIETRSIDITQSQLKNAKDLAIMLGMKTLHHEYTAVGHATKGRKIPLD